MATFAVCCKQFRYISDKHFGSRSGPTYIGPDLDQNVFHSDGIPEIILTKNQQMTKEACERDNEKSNQPVIGFTPCLQVLSSDNLCKQFGPIPG